MTEIWSKSELFNYIKTWSAYKRFKDENSEDIINNCFKKLSKDWIDDKRLEIKMDFTFYCGRKK